MYSQVMYMFFFRFFSITDDENIVCICTCLLSCFSPIWLFETCQTLSPMGFFWQEHWSELPCPPPGDISYPGIDSSWPYILCPKSEHMVHQFLVSFPNVRNNSGEVGWRPKTGHSVLILQGRQRLFETRMMKPFVYILIRSIYIWY